MVTIPPVPPPAPAAFTQEAMEAALPAARRLAMMLYAATKLPGDVFLAAHAADALAKVNAELSIGQRGDALAAAARAAGEVA
jgi:hypothetical protein